MGLDTGWISRLGNDEFGRYIFNFVRGEGIDISQVEFVDGYPTSLNFKEILEDGSGRTFYYRHHSPTIVLNQDSLNEIYIKNSKILHITGVFASIHKKNPDILKHAINIAKQNNVKISFDPNLRLKLWSLEEARKTLLEFLPDIDIILSGVEEAELLFGKNTVEGYIDILKSYNIQDIVLKRGEEGSVGYRENKIIFAPPVKPKSVIDTVGAGDGFNAGYIYSYLNGKNLEDSLKFANVIGSMVVSVSGDNEGLPYLEDVLVKMGKINRTAR